MNDFIRSTIELMFENSLRVITKTFVSKGYLVRINIEEIENIEEHFKIFRIVSYKQERTGNMLYGEINKLDMDKREVTVRWDDILSEKDESLHISVFPFDYALKKLTIRK